MLYSLSCNTADFPVFRVPWDYFKLKANIPNGFVHLFTMLNTQHLRVKKMHIEILVQIETRLE